jgi:hypothetical protein
MLRALGFLAFDRVADFVGVTNLILKRFFDSIGFAHAFEVCEGVECCIDVKRSCGASLHDLENST